MTTARRWWRFNLVGIVGAAMQLATLGLAQRWLGGRYLLATGLAMEVTLLHNFVWHQRFTWNDREDGSPPWQRLLKFQLSNGMVSLIGNLVLTRLLVQGAGLPVLLANGLAILCCSIVNFASGELWAFAPGAGPGVAPERIGPAETG